MEPNEILKNLEEALRAIVAPRFYETERGFQGELLVQLGKRLRLPDPAIMEQEYQKRAAEHGLTCRPDIIIHEPFEKGRHHDRSEGNLAVIELKVRSGANEAADDYGSLADIIRTLRYPLGIFINIASHQTFIELAPKDVEERVVGLAVDQRAGQVTILRESAGVPGSHSL